MFKHINRRTLATATVIALAGLPSAAAARPLYEQPGSSFTADPPTLQTAAPQPAPRADQQGFQWDDAGLGAAGMLVLLGAGSGAALTARRRSGRALPS